MRRRNQNSLLVFLQWFEKKVIRVIILGAALLAVTQLALGLATDPVDFYLTVAKQVESPPIEMENTEQNYKITLSAVPAAPVSVIQNGKVIGNLAKGQQELSVKAGKIQLDGRNVAQIVRVKVVKLDSFLVEPRVNQVFVIERKIQDVVIRP